MKLKLDSLNLSSDISNDKYFIVNIEIEETVDVSIKVHFFKNEIIKEDTELFWVHLENEFEFIFSVDERKEIFSFAENEVLKYIKIYST